MLHCSALLYTALHCCSACLRYCTALHYTTLHYTALHYTALHCTTLYYDTAVAVYISAKGLGGLVLGPDPARLLPVLLLLLLLLLLVPEGGEDTGPAGETCGGSGSDTAGYGSTTPYT